MKSKLKYFILMAIVLSTVLLISGCQTTTKTFGGETVIDLPAGDKLVPYTVQWEPETSDIWYLTEKAEPGYQPKVYEFKESSNLGTMEGKIIFKEH